MSVDGVPHAVQLCDAYSERGVLRAAFAVLFADRVAVFRGAVRLPGGGGALPVHAGGSSSGGCFDESALAVCRGFFGTVGFVCGASGGGGVFVFVLRAGRSGEHAGGVGGVCFGGWEVCVLCEGVLWG